MTSSFCFDSNLPQSGTTYINDYYWGIYDKNYNLKPAGQVFRDNFFYAFEPPAVLTPRNNQTYASSTGQVTLSWNAVPNSRYALTVTDLLTQGTVTHQDPLYSTSSTVPVSPNHSYSWQVWAINNSTGQWSLPSTATFNTVGQTFADVPPGATFFDEIQCLSSMGAVSGYDCGGSGEPCDAYHRPYYRTYNGVTRGQYSKMLALSKRWTLVNTPPSTYGVSYSDEPSTETFYSFIATGAAHGITEDYRYDSSVPWGTYSSGSAITRLSMAKQLAEANGWLGSTTPYDAFADMLHSSRGAAADFTDQMAAHGTMSGYTCVPVQELAGLSAMDMKGRKEG